jgi:hypothetical protein
MLQGYSGYSELRERQGQWWVGAQLSTGRAQQVWHVPRVGSPRARLAAVDHLDLDAKTCRKDLMP